MVGEFGRGSLLNAWWTGSRVEIEELGSKIHLMRSFPQAPTSSKSPHLLIVQLATFQKSHSEHEILETHVISKHNRETGLNSQHQKGRSKIKNKTKQ